MLKKKPRERILSAFAKFSYFALPLKEKNYILSWEIKISDPMVLLSRCFSPFLFSGICDQTPWKVSTHDLGEKDPYLEDHPRTRKWLITMVIVSPLNGVIPLPNGLTGLYIGVTNHLLTGMILQVACTLLPTTNKSS